MSSIAEAKTFFEIEFLIAQTYLDMDSKFVLVEVAQKLDVAIENAKQKLDEIINYLQTELKSVDTVVGFGFKLKMPSDGSVSGQELLEKLESVKACLIAETGKKQDVSKRSEAIH